MCVCVHNGPVICREKKQTTTLNSKKNLFEWKRDHLQTTYHNLERNDRVGELQAQNHNDSKSTKQIDARRSINAKISVRSQRREFAASAPTQKRIWPNSERSQLPSCCTPTFQRSVNRHRCSQQTKIYADQNWNQSRRRHPQIGGRQSRNRPNDVCYYIVPLRRKINQQKVKTQRKQTSKGRTNSNEALSS